MGDFECILRPGESIKDYPDYPRHEYFRRVLCNLLGNEMENGALPADFEMIGGMVRDICYHNALDYFGLEVPSPPGK
jgi:glucuronate isomerase